MAKAMPFRNRLQRCSQDNRASNILGYQLLL